MVLITGTTKLLGIIGDPVEHSLSPVMHNAAIKQMGIDYVYIPFPVKPNNLATAIAGFAAVDLVGFSVTIPHKQAIIPLLSKVTPEAEMIGAVNTVWRTDSGWQGTNTDVIGFVAPLKNLGRDWRKVTPVILGNGGAARAVVVGLIQLGCQEIHVVGRNKDKLAQFYQSWQNNREIITKLKIHYWEGLNALLPAAELLINTTPIGMYPHVKQSPLDAELFKKLSSGAIAYDLIYTPNPTQFLQLAKGKGAVIIDGLEMLVQQGVAALEIWLQQPVPVDVMRQSLQQREFDENF
ncbi:shikimate 5-dehydrogenase [Stanieria sp. NIES-3757]|nr:shikimate 5-dehydrogenase [Stanieria sp. NIES-3757]